MGNALAVGQVQHVQARDCTNDADRGPFGHIVFRRIRTNRQRNASAGFLRSQGFEE
jgi:hypothetical protein